MLHHFKNGLVVLTLLLLVGRSANGQSDSDVPVERSVIESGDSEYSEIAQGVSEQQDVEQVVIPDYCDTEDDTFEEPSECYNRRGGVVTYKGVFLYPYGSVSSYSLDSVDTSAGDSGAFYIDDTGRGYRAPVDLLPPAADPNDFQSKSLIAPPNLGFGEQPRLALFFFRPDGAKTDPEFPTIAYGLQLRPGVFYDTGALEGDSDVFFPGAIALDGSPAAHSRGQVNFNDFPDMLQSLPFRTQGDIQFQQLGFLDHGSVYVDAMHQSDNSYRARSVMGRGAIGNSDIVVGKAETAFGDLGSAPTLINNGAVPIGSVATMQASNRTFTGLSQVRYVYYWDTQLQTAFSLEDQDPSLFQDVSGVPDGGVLRRLPTFVGRMRFAGLNQFDSYQVAALVRPIAYNDVAFVDHDATGWGINATARFCDEDKFDALYLGVVAGEGIGGYIYGDFGAAVVEPSGEIRTLSNFGTYAAFQHLWFKDNDGANLSSNIAYGYALSDTATGDDNRELHQAWCNLLWNVNETSAFGFEYQYGRRRVGDGVDGDDHRIMFVCQFSKDSDKKHAQRLANVADSDAYSDMTSPPLYARRL